MRVLANFFSKLMQKYMPNSFIFAIIMTLIVFFASVMTHKAEGFAKVTDVVNMWGNGLWGLLAFAMQMALIVVTGTALASAPIVKKGLDSMTNVLNTPTKAIVGTTIFSFFACWLNYGFGLVSSALLARKLAVKIRTGLHYPLLVASAYSGFLVWHGGLSASIPLTVATAGNSAVVAVLGPDVAININETVFGPLNMTILAAMLVALPVTAYFMMPKGNDIHVLSDDVVAQIAKEEEESPVSNDTIAEKMENSFIITILLSVLGIGYLAMYIFSGKSIGLNTVITIFLFLGIILHKSPSSYLKAFSDGTGATSGILLQFPLYAGIQGMMIGSGLGASITASVVNAASANSLPVYTFFVSGLVNFFVPSGGGQWAVQGQLVLDTAKQLGADIPKAVMAISWGDAWTNMVQPFWALPLLSVAKLGVKDILGYTTIVLLVSGVIISALLYVF